MTQQDVGIVQSEINRRIGIYRTICEETTSSDSTAFMRGKIAALYDMKYMLERIYKGESIRGVKL